MRRVNKKFKIEFDTQVIFMKIVTFYILLRTCSMYVYVMYECIVHVVKVKGVVLHPSCFVSSYLVSVSAAASRAMCFLLNRRSRASLSFFHFNFNFLAFSGFVHSGPQWGMLRHLKQNSALQPNPLLLSHVMWSHPAILSKTPMHFGH